MIVETFKYLKGSADKREAVELQGILNNGIYIENCRVDLEFLLCKIYNFHCSNGSKLRIDSQLEAEILSFAQKEREKILLNYPVKTYEGWQESGLPIFEDYCKPGDITDRAMVDHFIEVLPPKTLTYTFVQAGGIQSIETDENKDHKATYATFVLISPSCWKFEGYCFEGERINRRQAKTRLEKRLERLKKIRKNF